MLKLCGNSLTLLNKTLLELFDLSRKIVKGQLDIRQRFKALLQTLKTVYFSDVSHKN